MYKGFHFIYEKTKHFETPVLIQKKILVIAKNKLSNCKITKKTYKLYKKNTYN